MEKEKYQPTPGEMRDAEQRMTHTEVRSSNDREDFEKVAKDSGLGIPQDFQLEAPEYFEDRSRGTISFLGVFNGHKVRARADILLPYPRNEGMPVKLKDLSDLAQPLDMEFYIDELRVSGSESSYLWERFVPFLSAWQKLDESTSISERIKARELLLWTEREAIRGAFPDLEI